MVRFKNRHLLVEFIDVSALAPFPALPSVGAPGPDDDDEATDDEGLDPEDELAPLSSAPFMLAQHGAPLFGDEGTGIIYKAVRGSVQGVFGDEGWGRVGSSFKVLYHSPLTTLTIVRVARPHYRLLWGGITLLSTVDGKPVLPRVIAVSGTIKKLQSAAVVHHRRNTAAAVAALVAQGEKAEAEKERLEAAVAREREALARVE